ncbi:hypothetical protein RhiirA1_440382 [Rhizophagus irregularis]|uniref:Uncharacterized protein n=1 Tax=Rhizophagus irregularis TaxID=588596 RepID=A0A2N0RZQ7_9GLOM|nr:hypothetical protein RhiirA1_440382 [Rhizophagus irregularis]
MCYTCSCKFNTCFYMFCATHVLVIATHVLESAILVLHDLVIAAHVPVSATHVFYMYDLSQESQNLVCVKYLIPTFLGDDIIDELQGKENSFCTTEKNGMMLTSCRGAGFHENIYYDVEAPVVKSFFNINLPSKRRLTNEKSTCIIY